MANSPQDRAISVATASAVAILSVLVLAHRHVIRPRSDVSTAAATVAQREFAGRITGFPYQRPKESLRVPQKASLALSLRAAGIASEDPHQAGLYHLVAGNSAEAVKFLERALAEATSVADVKRATAASGDHELLTHLSVAYGERGTTRRRASDFIRALACADRAWRLRATRETIWNRAVALQRLHLHDDARASWQLYLRNDSESTWVAEARERLRSTNVLSSANHWLRDGARLLDLDDGRLASLSAAFPLQVRRAAERDIVPGWAVAVLAGDEARAALFLRKLETIGVTRAQRSGDTFLADVATHIRSVPADRHVRNGLARTIIKLSDAKKAYDGGDGTSCRASLRQAIPELARSKSPLLEYARFYTASSYYHDNDYASLRRDAGTLNISARYRALRAQTSWIRGLGEMSSGRPDHALRHYQEALAAFDAMGESDYAAAAHNLLAEAYDYLDSAEEAWNHRERALALVSRLGPASTQWVQLLNGSAQLLLAAEEPAVAKIFLDRAIQQPAAADDSLFLSSTTAWQAVALHQLGRHADARSAWRRATSVAARIPTGAVRERALNDVTLRRALTLERDLAPAEMQTAVAFAKRAANRWALPRLLRLQGDVLADQGSYAAAMRTYSAALDEIFDQRRKTTLMRYELANRASLIDVTERALSLAVGRGDFESAFRFSERSAGAALPSPAPSPATVIPPNVAVIKVISLSDRVVTWTMTASGVHVRQQPVTLDEVRRATDALAGAMRDAAAMRLGRIVVAPSLLHSGAIDTLVFVPDASFATVRFASLTHPVTGRPLIERYAVAECHTVSSYLSAIGALKASGEPRVLLIDGSRSGTLRRLGAADKEIRELRHSYTSAVTWEAGSGNRATLVAALESAGMVHFAAHAVVDRTNELLSNIVLGGSDTLLYAHEVAALRFEKRPIVVLATCSGARATEARRRRSPTLADAFLAAGASAVVASSEDLDDARARRFSLMLHDRLRRGLTVGAALRDIQMAFAGEGRRWDDLIVVGNPGATFNQLITKGMKKDA